MAFENILFLALIQGITEFIPVSSSGHLTLLHAWMPSDQAAADALTDNSMHDLTMDVALHFGTLIAVIVYFRAEVKNLVHGGVDILTRRETQNRAQAIHLILATVPVLLAAAALLASGLLDALRTPEVVAWASLIFAVPLYLADRFGASDKTLASVENRSALWLGLAQILALIPGASRSGVTLMAARGLGFEREAAARFSMLMAIPVISCFAALSLLQLILQGQWGALGEAALGAILAGGFAFLSIDVFLRMTRKVSLLPFVIYRVALGGAILWLL